jgi:hypothetical protein
MDVFVYVVVLNLAVQYVPSVISETFTLSLLTAVLLKVALEAVILLKGKILSWFVRPRRGPDGGQPRRCCGSRRPAARASFSSW